jgi:hypothetical protein
LRILRWGGRFGDEDNPKPQLSIYQSLGDGQKIRVRIEDENVWLTQKLIAELFDVDVRTVKGSGTVIRKQAEKKALEEYEKYRQEQDKKYVSRF